MQQIEDAGFKWSMSRQNTFDERYAELMTYKEECGHCNVSRRGSGEYPSIGSWCNDVTTSYKKVQKGGTPHPNMQLLEGFQVEPSSKQVR